MEMVRTSFADPRRNKERLFGGPHFISGWSLETPEGTRLFDYDRETMWFESIAHVCWREGLNYEGHRIV